MLEQTNTMSLDNISLTTLTFMLQKGRVCPSPALLSLLLPLYPRPLTLPPLSPRSPSLPPPLIEHQHQILIFCFAFSDWLQKGRVCLSPAPLCPSPPPPPSSSHPSPTLSPLPLSPLLPLSSTSIKSSYSALLSVTDVCCDDGVVISRGCRRLPKQKRIGEP